MCDESYMVNIPKNQSLFDFFSLSFSVIIWCLAFILAVSLLSSHKIFLWSLQSSINQTHKVISHTERCVMRGHIRLFHFSFACTCLCYVLVLVSLFHTDSHQIRMEWNSLATIGCSHWKSCLLIWRIDINSTSIRCFAVVVTLILCKCFRSYSSMNTEYSSFFVTNLVLK